MRVTLVGLVGLVLLAETVAAAAPGRAEPTQPTRVLVPAHADRLAALLSPYRFEEPFADGCRIPAVALDRSTVRLTVTEPDGTTGTLALAPPASEGASGGAASPSFRARFAPTAAGDGGEAWPSCAALVWQTIQAADDGRFWAPVDLPGQRAAAGGPRRDAPPPPAAPLTRSEAPRSDVLSLAFYRLLQVLWVLVGGWAAFALARPGGPLKTLTGRELLALVGALVAGVLLRTLWAEPALIHENYCGVGRLACADRPPCHSLTGNHSWASFAFYNLVLGLSGGATEGVFVANVVLMAVVQPLLVFVLARDLAGSPRAAVLAAWALALLPLHVRMSPTESFFPAAMAVLLGSLIAIRAAARGGGVGRAALAAALVALTVQTSRVYNLHAALALGVLLLARPDWRRLGWRARAVTVTVFGALTAPHYVEILGTATQGAARYLPGGPLEFLANLTFGNLFLDPQVTPPGLAVAWLAGTAVLLARRLREGLTVLLLLVGLGLVFLICDPADVDWPTRVRMQVSLAPFVALLAGAGLAPLTRRRWGIVGLAALGAASVPFLPPQHAFVRELLLPAREGRFLLDAIPRLPAFDVLVTVDVEERLPEAGPTGDPVETHFPEHELRRHHDRVERRSVSELLERPALVSGRRVLFYEGANAHAWLPEELAATGASPGPRPAVIELRRRFRLTPLPGLAATLPNDNPPGVRFRLPRPTVGVGFYQLTEP